MAKIDFDDVSKAYPDGTRAVSHLDLRIGDGDFTVLVGPSGCGKTTALRMVAGLEEITDGELRIDDQVVNSLEPRKRDVAMVFQNYALYPHMSVFENIAFPLRSKGLSRSEVRIRVERTAALLGLRDMLGRRPKVLSGGQRQRVAMGRAIVREPKVFLLDEPLSNLDAKLRLQMRGEISNLQRELGVTTIYVTHDQVEAMTMGSRIAVMREGVLQQEGPPQVIYDEPANLFVGTFVGSPPMTTFRAWLEVDEVGFVFRSGQQCVRLPRRFAATRRDLDAYVGRELVLGVRPEHFSHAAGSGEDMPHIRGRVRLVEPLGPDRLIHVEVAAEPVLTDDVLDVARDIDSAALETLQAQAREHKVTSMTRVGAHSRLHAGDDVELAVAIEHAHFFDLESGNAIT